MNKKPFKDIEHIIKNAAEAYEPAFDEHAWQKMEGLLDKEKDKTRPPFLWLWWLLPIAIGIVAGGYYIFNKKDVSGKEQNIVIQKNNPAPVLRVKTNPQLVTVAEAIPNNAPQFGAAVTNNAADIKTSSQSLPSPLKAGKYSSPSTNALQTANDITAQKKNKSAQLSSKALISINGDNAGDDVKEDLKEVKIPEALNIAKTNEDNAADILTVQKQQTVKKDILTANKEDTLSKKSFADKKIKGRPSKFYFMVSAGADANGVKLFSSQKITARAGFTAGYQLTKKISLQSGFFVSSKKYVAGPADYKTKPGTYWSMVDITKINANCRVYEIPLLVRYDFAPRKKINYFSSAGLSSYIMKKEDYHYFYKRWGTAHDASASYKGNQHLFSVLKLSAGVEKKLSEQFSLNAVPGLAIPLAGVGEGQVKLYSADIMIGLKFTPLRKK